MRFFSKIFGSRETEKDNAALRAAFDRIQRILEDEEFQLEMVNPAIRDILRVGFKSL